MLSDYIYSGSDYKIIRNRLKLTQSEVADAIGISRHSLSNYEYEKADMPLTVSIRLSKYYRFKADNEIKKLSLNLI